MKKNYLLKGFFAVAVVMLAACDKNEPAAVTPVGEEITVTATHEGGMSRLTHNDATPGGTGTGLGVTWSAGDAFMVYRSGAGSKFTLQTAAGAATGNFKGTAPAGTGSYTAFFPAAKSDVMLADCHFSVLGQVQKGAASTSHLSDYNFMTATATALPAELTFSHKVAVLKFVLDLGGKFPKSLALSSQEGENITVVQKAATGATVASSKQLPLRIFKADGTAADFTSFTAYMAVLPSTLTQKLAVAVTCTDGTIYTYAVNIPSQVSYLAGKVYDAQLTAGTGGFANTASVFDDTTVATSTAAISGSGNSAADPYLISSAADLKWMVEQINGPTTNADYTGKYFKLTTDLRIASTTWTPIGNSSYSFKGNFDGGGHTVSGEMAVTSLSWIYFGFFGYIQDNTSVRNLHISADVTVNGATNVVYAGGVAGYAEGNLSTRYFSDISGCTMSGNTTINTNMPIAAGGIVGVKAAFCNITSCNNYGNITVTSTGSYVSIGGIMGDAGSYHSDYPSVISYCTNYGRISATSPVNSSCAGGLAGVFAESVKYCRNEGAIEASSNSGAYSYIGGIVGDLLDGTLHTSHNASASITTGGTGNIYRGSIAGSAVGFAYSCCTSVEIDGVPLIGSGTVTTPDVPAQH